MLRYIDLKDRASLFAALPRGGKVVEVGVERGEFSKVILDRNQPAQLWLIDAWADQLGTEWAANDPCAREQQAKNLAHVRARFAGESRVFIRQEFSVAAAAQFEDGSLDVVYIDADHHKAGEDIEAWWPKVRPGGWLTGHDYALTEWIKVRPQVDAWVAKVGLRLWVTRDGWPSWAVRKPLPGEIQEATVAAGPSDDVTLLMSVYEPYSYLLAGTLACLCQHWPDHPRLVMDAGSAPQLHLRLLDLCRKAKTDFVITMHEDFRLCQPVRVELFRTALGVMRCDPGIVSCSLTWEPTNVSPYRYPLEPYSIQFRTIPWSWDYAMNLQMRLWRRDALMAVLESVPAQAKNATLEPEMTRAARNLFAGRRVVTYTFPDPPVRSTFVDSTDKAAWIIGYDNIIHSGKILHRYPVVINNRDRLTTTKNMVEYLAEYTPEAIPIILDNASTYPPLLEWYKALPSGCNLIRMKVNYGPQAPWSALPRPALECGLPYYCVTDSDLDLSGVPPDFFSMLRRGLESDRRLLKVGLGIRIDDLPDTPLARRARDWEKPHFWNPEDRRGDFYLGAIDTSFAMYRSGSGWGGTNPHTALRTAPPYLVRHVPWYSPTPPDAEEAYYREHCDLKWATWVRWGKEVGA